MSFIPVNTSEFKDFSGYTLVLPTVSIGNVAQLAVDLLLSTYDGIQRVGIYYDPNNVQPYAAPDALAKKPKDVKGDLTFGIELYADPVQKLVIWQQRSPVIVGRIQAFSSGVVNFITSSGFRRVILLTSDFNYDRNDAQLMRRQTFAYFATSKAMQTFGTTVKDTLGWVYVTPRENAYAGTRYEHGAEFVPRRGYGDVDDAVDEMPTESKSHAKSDAADASKKILTLGHGGVESIASQCEEKGIELLGLVALTTEGDNADDAIQLATRLQELFVSSQDARTVQYVPANVQWKAPLAWKYVYGGAATSSGIYS